MDIENDMQIFEDKVKEIFFYCCRYGVYTLFKGTPPTESFDKLELNRLCLEGFKVAQRKIVVELKTLQVIRKDKQAEIKKAKLERNKDLEKLLTKEFKVLDYQNDVFKNLADAIAWQMLNGEHYLYRRLYTDEPGEKDLNDDSFGYVIDFSEKVNEDPDSFCLITDITNNIQLGDCLIVDREGIKISEIKSGAANVKALEFIKKENLKESNYDEGQLKNEFDDKLVEQIKRMLTQQGKIDRAATIIKENEGEDPKNKNSTVKIIENDFPIEFYHSTLVELIKELENKDWAYSCIEAIVHIGVYKNDWRILGQASMKSLCDPFPFTDLMASRKIKICEPIFMKPFPDSIIMDIVLGRIKIYIGVDFEKLIEFANLLGIKSSWSTSKELHKYLDSKSNNSAEIFSFNNRGIKISINGQDMFLGNGFIGKIMFDHFLPSTMLLKYQDQLTTN